MLPHICCIVVQPSAPASVFLVLWVAFMLLVSMFSRCSLVLQGCARAAGFLVFSVLPGPPGLRSCCWFPCFLCAPWSSWVALMLLVSMFGPCAIPPLFSTQVYSHFSCSDIAVPLNFVSIYSIQVFAHFSCSALAVPHHVSGLSHAAQHLFMLS